ncbi:MAG: hypothetical protein LAO31_17560 [Acidobacteriia bacterium]|nr:hypothetical protein [Terriglobia bacterium]
MPRATQVIFNFKELAEILVEKEDIHEGHWGIFVKFGIGAINAPHQSGAFVPTALVPILELGIQRFDQPNDLSVDASVVNAAKNKAGKRTKKKK